MSWTDFAAGCIGGSASVFVGHPFDTVKVKLQTSSQLSLKNCILSTFRQGKFAGFFKGMLFPIASSGIVNSIFFGAYGHTCQLLGENNYTNLKKECRPKYWAIFVGGVIGGIAQLGIMIPVDVVKVKLQAQNTSVAAPNKTPQIMYSGSANCIKQLWKNNGIKGIYQGASIQFVRDVPAFGLYMLMYEFMLYHLSMKSDFIVVNCLLAGGLAGAISWASIIPLDVAKSRIQVNDPSCPRYPGRMVNCLVGMYREAGIPIFFKGLSLVTLRAFPVNAVQLTLYSVSLTLLNNNFAS